MNNLQSFQRFAAWALIISFLFDLGNIVTTILAFPNLSADIFTNPSLALSVSADQARLVRWAMIFDLFGYYLPLLPAALFLWRWLEPTNPDWAVFYTVCGLGYILIGAIGAVIFAVVYAPLAAAYAAASPDGQAVLETVFGVVVSMIYGGMWNILGELLAGVWFFGIGFLLQNERRIFAIVSMVLGVAALLDSFGNIVDIESLASLGLYTYLLLAPIWALWLGLDLLRKPVQIARIEP